MTNRLWAFLPIVAVSFGVGVSGCGSTKGEAKAFSTIEIDPAATLVEVDNSFSADYTVTIRNTGQKRALNISEIRLDYTPLTEDEALMGGAFNVSLPGLPATVKAAGEGDLWEQSVDFIVSFTRFEDFLPRTATVTIVNDNTVDAGRQNLQIRFQTRQCEPSLGLPAQIDFLQVGFEDTKDELLALNNTGSCRLVIDWIRLDGRPSFEVVIGDQVIPASEDFEQIVLDPPFTVEPNSSAIWTTRFTPIDGEADRATLILHSNNTNSVEGLNQIELVANSTGPKLEVDPNPIEFGAKMIGKVAPLNVKLISAGTADLVITGIQVVHVESLGEFAIDLTSLPNGAPTAANPLTLAVNESVEVRATYMPPSQPSPLDENDVPIRDTANLVIDNNTFGGETVVPMNGFGVAAECPSPVILIEEGEEVGPVTVLHLHGEQSTAANGTITKYSWTVQQPEDNKFNFVPTATFPNPTHQANVAGEYTYCLDVCDADKCSSDLDCRSTACKKVTVIPDQAILCELTWRTPGDLDEFDEGQDAGSDLDLHFAHPFATGPDLDGDGKPDGWFDIPYDVFWFNKNPDWETMNPSARDDPSLDRDDTDGAGPETVTLDAPVAGRVYRVGVHYWDDHGFGLAYPRLKCYIRGELVFDRNLEDSGIHLLRCDMWEAATITWPQGIVTEVKKPDGSPKITPQYQNAAFVSITGGNCNP